jgi:glutamate synthase domain-containing protein 3
MEYIDISKIEKQAVNHVISETLKETPQITLTHVNAMHNICAGLSGKGEVIIDDSTGLYTGSFLEDLTVRVKGSVGWYAGDDMMSGELIIEKNTGCNVGAYINGGNIVVYGNTGSRVGYGMKGGNIIICGNAGRWGGIMSMGGSLIVLGNIGAETGESMYNGKIFTRDPEAERKMGNNVFLDKITDEEIETLNQLFEQYAIDATGESFRVIRPLKTGRHSYQLFKPVLEPEKAKKHMIKKG